MLACSKLSADVATAANECVCCKQGCAEFLSDKKIVEGHMCLMYMHLPSTIACMFCLVQFVVRMECQNI